MWQMLFSDEDNIQKKPAGRISLLQLSVSSATNWIMPVPEIKSATEKRVRVVCNVCLDHMERLMFSFKICLQIILQVLQVADIS